MLGHIDHDFSPKEKAAYEMINTVVMRGIDLKVIESEIEQLEVMSHHEDNVFENSKNNSMFESFFNKLLKMANPGDFKFRK